MQPTPHGPPDAPARDAFALLADTHDDLRRRFDALVAPHWRPAPTRRALVDAGLWLNVHAAVATALVYPAVRAGTGDGAALARAEADLHELLDALEDLLASDRTESDLAARLASLRYQVERQFAEEEVALFSQLAAADLDVDELGRRCSEQRRALLAELGLGDATH
jgi:hypothetical protein